MGDRRSSRRRSRASEKAKQENEQHENDNVDYEQNQNSINKNRSSKRHTDQKNIKQKDDTKQPDEDDVLDEEVLEEEITGGKAENQLNQDADQNDPSSSKHLGKRKRDRSRNEFVSSKNQIRTTDTFIFFDRLLVELSDNPTCDLFLKPVLEMWDEKDIPDYRERIKTPMDLGTVRRKMTNDDYVILDKNTRQYYFDQDACSNDIKLIFKNCMIYNEEESELHQTASKLLDQVSEKISTRENRLVRIQEKAKRDSERKRRKAAEESAALAAQKAARTALALAKAKQEAADEKKKRELELKKKEAEWVRRLEEEKEQAVKQAVQAALEKQKKEQEKVQQAAPSQSQTLVAATTATTPAGSSRHHHQNVNQQSKNQSKMVNTSSVSSDEQEGHGEINFAFVSTEGMEKKRGRKSTTVMELELQHDDLMRRRRIMVEVNLDLEKAKQIQMTQDEKRKLCDQVAELDFVRMKGVVDIIASGMSRPDILNEVFIDIDIDTISNDVLREVEFFLKNPVAMTAKEALRNIESQITDIETKLVEIRYQKIVA